MSSAASAWPRLRCAARTRAAGRAAHAELERHVQVRAGGTRRGDLHHRPLGAREAWLALVARRGTLALLERGAGGSGCPPAAVVDELIG